MSSTELKLLQKWQVRLAAVMAIILPTIAVTTAFSDVKNSIDIKDAAVNARISEVQLQVEKNFADKPTMNQIQKDIQVLRENMVEIKTLLKRR